MIKFSTCDLTKCSESWWALVSPLWHVTFWIRIYLWPTRTKKPDISYQNNFWDTRLSVSKVYWHNEEITYKRNCMHVSKNQYSRIELISLYRVIPDDMRFVWFELLKQSRKTKTKLVIVHPLSQAEVGQCAWLMVK